MVRHLSEQKNAVKKRVQKLSTSNALDTVFEVYDAGTNQKYTTSVFDYFLKKYQIRLKHPELPLLITKDGAFPMVDLYSNPLNTTTDLLNRKSASQPKG